jgi:hypothetical protein
VISGGFDAVEGNPAPVSRALGNRAWLVRTFDSSFTGYAYCSKTMRASHAHNSVDVTDTVNTSVDATCPSGTRVVSGGYRMANPGGQSNSPIYSTFASGQRKWSILALLSDVPNSLKAFAYCADAPPVTIRTATGAAPSNDSGTATVSCKSGEELLSGGYETTPTPDWHNTDGPDTFIHSSSRSGVRAWTVSAFNYSSVAGQLVAYAICA